MWNGKVPSLAAAPMGCTNAVIAHGTGVSLELPAGSIFIVFSSTVEYLSVWYCCQDMLSMLRTSRALLQIGRAAEPVVPRRVLKVT